MARTGGIAAALCLAAACGCGSPGSPRAWTLWTIDTLAARGDPGYVPAGSTLRLLSSPFASGIARQKASNPGLTVFPAFSEGQTAAYVTTEVWQNFDKVWVQPLYIPIGAGLPAGTKSIFGVDTTTRFYSPYWQIFFYTPPPGQVFKTTRDVLDSGVALIPGPGKFCAITRDKSLYAVVAEGSDHPVRPLSNEPVFYDPATKPPAVLIGSAYAEGEDVWFFDLGVNRFNWNYETLVVDETPLFAFLRADGTPLDLPKVGGTGPWRHPACDGHGTCGGVPPAQQIKPQFGALWRIWNVVLPDAAGTAVDIYVPQSRPELRAYVQAQGFAATLPKKDDDQFTLRVAIDGKTCFATGALDKCKWLDSQNAIEGLIADWKTTETRTLVSCPLVLFNGKAIGP